MKALSLKTFLYGIILLFLPIKAVINLQSITLPTLCDTAYIADTKRILRQMAGFTPEKLLKKYGEYLNLIKQLDDLDFYIHNFEAQIGTPRIAVVRTPATLYNSCRNQRVVHKAIAAKLCDTTYAANMKNALNQLGLSERDRYQLEAYRDHMIRLKLLADTRFKIQAIEHVLNLGTVSTLRAPLTRYLGCRDQIFRAAAASTTNVPLVTSTSGYLTQR